MNIYTLERETMDGLTGMDVVRNKIARMERSKTALRKRIDDTCERLDNMRTRYSAQRTPRRERLALEVDIEVTQNSLDRLYDDYNAVSAELRGMRKAIDAIVYIDNHGGLLTEQNRGYIDSIMSA